MFLIVSLFHFYGTSIGRNISYSYTAYEYQPELMKQADSTDTVLKRLSLKELNANLRTSLEQANFDSASIVASAIIREINKSEGPGHEPGTLATASYLTGVYYLFVRNYVESIKYLRLSADLKEGMQEWDERYAKTLYNLGVAYNGLGDFSSQEIYSLESLEIEKKLYGDSSPLLIKTYSLLIIAYLGLQEYEKSVEFSKVALSIAGARPDEVSREDLATLYNNLGVLYLRLEDYSKAVVYLEKAELLHNLEKSRSDENYFTLLNTLAIAYGSLGMKERSEEYYNRIIGNALSYNSFFAYNIINSYAILLGKSGKREKGEYLLRSALQRAKKNLGEESPVYFIVLFNYAEYLREFRIDNNSSIEYYRKCLDYLSRNRRNLLLKDPLYIGYSLSLAEQGKTEEALETIQSLIIPDSGKEKIQEGENSYYPNPGLNNLKADRITLRILKTKYNILWLNYRKNGSMENLGAAASTARLIVELLEKIRINISEEESRLILGDRYRDSYLNAIRDYDLLYDLTGEKKYLESSFEFLEKSKVAALLSSTRELKAAQFNIPPGLAEMERKLKRDISILSSRIDEELANDLPDNRLIEGWKESILKSSLVRDSLVAVFEKEYPGYYSFKYNAGAMQLDDLPSLIGRNGNYINYVLSDTLLYIFVANRKSKQLLSLPVDSSFFADVLTFRELLSSPVFSGNAREAFEKYQVAGSRLYSKIIEPVKKYLISGELLISPDNILSYIPFEILPTTSEVNTSLRYNQLTYMMKDYDISYSYSATFLSESTGKRSVSGNRLIAFAPDYSEPVDINAVLMNRQVSQGRLNDLPFARQEAEYVSELANGKLLENEEAAEAAFKKEAGEYDIIHLAMHTILNDRDPMRSTLIFSSGKDTTEDRFLRTYEIYGIPLRAKMVVLSSCNSGSGYLYSGEGILSLARGFMYSGSESVVMAMWEIEDRSGTEVVKRFYDYLRKGYSKSQALRKARTDYLNQADQLRSHPYFWSALVVYGNNQPIYYSGKLILIPLIAAAAVIFLAVLYYRRRRYS